MTVTIQTTINAPIEKVWKYWTDPEHITKWNYASDDWICPSAVNDLQPKGKFNWRMESKDGSMGFDFTGTYEEIDLHELIFFKMSDGRSVQITFSEIGKEVKIMEAFETEGSNSEAQQKAGWQAILSNFKKYVEEQVNQPKVSV
ncbi:SRPBCC family protein [Reichenbachiella versicolor]|uniref:SRPBCC family protein n=1 Tax=Reichenbachiella versicolor TaxID=1821036 RepID=UPI000D6EA2DF|nr:SRPBCC family protein [Reichenbachiella versicolor]